MRTLKGKTMFGISIIAVTIGLLINILFRQAVYKNIENMIENDLKSLSVSLKESISNEIILNEIPITNMGMEKKGFELVNNLNRRYNYFIALCDLDGNIIEYSKSSLVPIDKSWFADKFKNNNSIHIKYIDGNVIGVLKYSCYEKNQYIGTILLEKSYKDILKSSMSLVNIISVIEIVLFILFLGVVFIFLTRITLPLTILSKHMEKAEENNYETIILPHKDDELGILIKSYNGMVKKIVESITELKEEKEKVEKLANTQKQFFDNATHELKTPLTVIKGYAQLLGEKVEDSEFNDRAINRIGVESDRLHNLVCRILKMSKEKNNSKKEIKKVNIKALILKVIEDLQKVYGKEILYHFEELSESYLHIDRDEFYQVLLNLLDNASKYSKDKKIIIKADSSSELLEIKISNLCNEIPEEIKSNLFDPFVKYQFGKEIDSTGLGLYIAKELAIDNGGDIQYEINDDIITFKIKFFQNGNNFVTSDEKS